MRRASWMIGILAMIPLTLSAGEKQVGPKSAEEIVPPDAHAKTEYKEFSKLLHSMALKELPKEFADASGWGGTIPVPPNLRLPRLRTYIKEGDKVVVPHGAWRRFKGRIEEPDKNLKIHVKEFKKLDDKAYRLVMDIDVTVYCQGEWQQWQKGLLLIGAKGDADAHLTAAVVCDIGVALNLKKFPPELNIKPKVTELGLNLVDFKFRNAPPILRDDNPDGLGADLKDLLRTLVKASEPTVKEHVNQAIAEGLREGKGNISAATILKSLPAPKK